MLHEFTFRNDNYVIDCKNSTAEKLASQGKPKANGINIPCEISDHGEEQEFIKTIELLVSQQCNLACTYCYADGGEYGAPGKMQFDTAAKSVDYLFANSGPHQNLSVSFFGGEPLIEYDTIVRLVRYSKDLAKSHQKNVSFSMTTNGMLLDAEKIAFFKENAVNVMVSVDGDKETHDRQRPLKNGKGSSQVIFPKLAALLAELPESPARATVTDSSRTPKDTKQALRDLGFKNTGMSVASETLFDDVEVGEVSSKGMQELIEEEAEEFLNLIKLRDATKLVEFDSSIPHYVMDFLDGKKNKYPCGAGRKMLAVSADGDIFPCHRFVGVEEFRVGNVNEDRRVPLPVFEGSPVELSSECSSCFAKDMCGGACYHDSVTSTGSLLKPNKNFCATVRRSVEMAAYISANMTKHDIDFLRNSLSRAEDNCPLDLF